MEVGDGSRREGREAGRQRLRDRVWERASVRERRREWGKGEWMDGWMDAWVDGWCEGGRMRRENSKGTRACEELSLLVKSPTTPVFMHIWTSLKGRSGVLSTIHFATEHAKVNDEG